LNLLHTKINDNFNSRVEEIQNLFLKSEFKVQEEISKFDYQIRILKDEITSCSSLIKSFQFDRQELTKQVEGVKKLSFKQMELIEGVRSEMLP